MQNKLKIAVFLIDDDEGTRVMLDSLLHKNGIINYSIYSEPEKLLRDLHKGVQICVIDYYLNDAMFTGLEVMRAVLDQNPYCKCIIMSACEEAGLIKDFLNSGAFKYITKGEKDFSQNLIAYIRKAIELIAETFDFYSTVLEHAHGATAELRLVKDHG